MKQKTAFTMQLYPGFAAEYKRRHAQLWPEIKALLHESGISDYTIFLDEDTNLLFAVQQNEENKSALQLGELEIVQKWWTFMADIMETNPDNSPVAKPLTRVFHMD
jgi:L-rhamnose mutarotase